MSSGGFGQLIQGLGGLFGNIAAPGVVTAGQMGPKPAPSEPPGGPVLPGPFPPTGMPGTPIEPHVSPGIPGEPVSAPPPIAGLESTPPPRGVSGWLSHPENRAALLQASIMLMQPPAIGQSTIGQVGQALGAGGEARDKVILGQEARDIAAANQLLEERKVAADEERARAATTAAEKSGGANGLTTYQALQYNRALRKDFMGWLKGEKDLEFDPKDIDTQDPAVQDALVQKFMAEQGMVDRALGGGGPTRLGEAVPEAPAAPAGAPTPAAIAYLRANRGTAAEFEKKYGLAPGGAAKYL